MTAAHIPVLLNEVLAMLAPTDGEVFVDGTFGAGGYGRAILEAADCTVWGIDRDPGVAPVAAALGQEFPDRFHFCAGRFGDMDTLLAEAGVDRVDGVVLDIGVSSMQLDEAGRGFSFQAEGPLDMRMEGEGPTAADVVNTSSAEDLADIIYKYGEERLSRRIARAIVAVRADRPFSKTSELARVIEDTIGRKTGSRKPGKTIHPATRTFQALRIYVNDELGELERGLAAAERLLSPEGRLCVVSFHSLEDRIVKTFLKERSGERAGVSRHAPEVEVTRAPSFSPIGRKAVRPDDRELTANPRARSARLRGAVRTHAPAWDEGVAA